ncbi:hypothetical protein, partial [Burkholderia ambifaria]|uniref:hypothetical protein n=1 Tax=Burkholderia ambifaria TaxID=152480 RepID=UPI0012FE02DC
MKAHLDRDALKKLADFFGLNSPPYNAIVAAAERSPFLAAELNAFAKLKDWEFARAEEGKGVYADPKN